MVLPRQMRLAQAGMNGLRRPSADQVAIAIGVELDGATIQSFEVTFSRDRVGCPVLRETPSQLALQGLGDSGTVQMRKSMQDQFLDVYFDRRLHHLLFTATH
jgi:hypothetical protein